MEANLVVIKELKKFIENDQMKSSLARAIGTLNIRIDVDRMINLFMSYCQRTPRLLECSKMTLFNALQFVTQCGLEPLFGQIYLVPFRNNKTGETDCQVIIGYKGLVALAIRSGFVSHVESRVVYDCDTIPPGEFDIELGDAPRLHHKPNWRDRKPNSGMIGAYCIVTMTSGVKVTDFMNKAEIEAIRDRSRAKDDGPWRTDAGEMWRKTVTRRALKYTPMSVEDLNVNEFEDATATTPSMSADELKRPLPGSTVVSPSALPSPSVAMTVTEMAEASGAVVQQVASAEEAAAEVAQEAAPPAAPTTTPAETQEKPKGTEGLKDELRKRRGRPKKEGGAEEVVHPQAAAAPAVAPPAPATAAPTPAPAPAAAPKQEAAKQEAAKQEAPPPPAPPAPAAPAPAAATATPPTSASEFDGLLDGIKTLSPDDLRTRVLSTLDLAKKRIPARINEVLHDNLITSEEELKSIGKIALRNVLTSFVDALKETPPEPQG